MYYFTATVLAAVLMLMVASAIPAQAAELGHYSPALLGNRDFIMPEPGLYYLQYVLYYTTDTLKDKNGKSIRSIDVGPLEFKVETDVDSYMIVPTLVYATDYEILGARYAVLISQPFGNVSMQAALESDTIPDFGLEVDESSFGLGDTYIRPLWLSWNLGRFDVGTAYSLYLPTGKYDDGEADNVGLGMWTHEFMANVAYYLDEQRGTALTLAGIYEIHHEKDDIDITPGSHLSINAGISQYLPLTEQWLAELGVAGIAQWQMTRDRGSDAPNKSVKDQVYGIGPEVGLIYLPWEAQFRFRWIHEFEAEDRFEGDFLTFTAAFSF
jgi:hypothetical protein